MVDLNLADIIGKIIFILIAILIFYFSYKTVRLEKIGKMSKFFGWLAGIFLIVCSIFVLIIAFFAFQSPKLTFPLAIILIVLVIFSFGIIFTGIVLIFFASGKIEKIKKGLNKHSKLR